MLREIALSAGIFLSGAGCYQVLKHAPDLSSDDSALIEALSKDYAIQDTTIMGDIPIQRQKYESYEKLKEGYSHPEWVDRLIDTIKQINMDTLETEYEENTDLLLEEMLADSSDEPVTAFLIGECYKIKIDLKKAFEYYEKAMQLGLEHSSLYQYIADEKLGKIDNELSVTAGKLRVKENRGDAGTDYLKAKKDELLKQSQELISLYQKAIELDPMNKLAYYHLSEVYTLNEMYTDALRTVNKAFEIPPTEFNDYVNRMYIIEKMFKKENLSEEVKKVIKERYLRDIEIAFSNNALFLDVAHGYIINSGIFTEQEIRDFEEKYKDLLQSDIIQEIKRRYDETIQKEK